MKIKEWIRRIMPVFIKKAYDIQRELKDLRQVRRLDCETVNLCPRSSINLGDIFSKGEIEQRWVATSQKNSAFSIPDGTGGVNLGDRKAIYYLISSLKPSSVLEVGTHVGASTLNIASALLMNQIKDDGKPADLISVDISDVNSEALKPWLRHGSKKSPREMIDVAGCGAFVQFVTDTSLSYFAKCERRFDFIFLDGDHTAKTVYQEIPAALKLLNPNGVILLHDYFPGMKPLWSNGYVIPGTFAGAERLVNEGADLIVLPLGELPWTTKLQSCVTSLALLLRKA